MLPINCNKQEMRFHFFPGYQSKFILKFDRSLLLSKLTLLQENRKSYKIPKLESVYNFTAFLPLFAFIPQHLKSDIHLHSYPGSIFSKFLSVHLCFQFLSLFSVLGLLTPWKHWALTAPCIYILFSCTLFLKSFSLCLAR